MTGSHHRWLVCLLPFHHGTVEQRPIAHGCGELSGAGAACSVAAKQLDLDPQGRWFDPRCGRGKICAAVGPLSQALNPTLLQGGMSPAESN